MGVGTKLITGYDQPALGAVYKLVSIETDDGTMSDRIKLSNNAEKVTTPGKKMFIVSLITKQARLRATISRLKVKILMTNLH